MPRKENREHNVSIWLSTSEKAAISREVAISGETMSAYIRRAIRELRIRSHLDEDALQLEWPIEPSAIWERYMARQRRLTQELMGALDISQVFGHDVTRVHKPEEPDEEDT